MWDNTLLKWRCGTDIWFKQRRFECVEARNVILTTVFRDIYSGQRWAPSKNIDGDCLDFWRKDYSFQSIASCEGVFSNMRNRVWNTKSLQRFAVLESPFTDGGYRWRNLDWLKPLAPRKSAIVYSFNRIRDEWFVTSTQKSICMWSNDPIASFTGVKVFAPGFNFNFL